MGKFMSKWWEQYELRRLFHFSNSCSWTILITHLVSGKMYHAAFKSNKQRPLWRLYMYVVHVWSYSYQYQYCGVYIAKECACDARDFIMHTLLVIPMIWFSYFSSTVFIFFPSLGVCKCVYAVHVANFFSICILFFLLSFVIFLHLFIKRCK